MYVCTYVCTYVCNSADYVQFRLHIKVICSTNSNIFTKSWVLVVYLVPLQSNTCIINNLSMYVYEHFKFIFVAFTTLVNAYFD